MQYVGELLVFIYLCICAYWDLRYKRIPWRVQGLGLIFVCVILIIQWNNLNFMYFFSFVPGICLGLLSWITKESIGYADGICVALLGGMAGFSKCLWIVCISMLLVSLFGLVMLVLKKMTRKSKIPYLPFLLVSESLLMVFRIL